MHKSLAISAILLCTVAAGAALAAERPAYDGKHGLYLNTPVDEAIDKALDRVDNIEKKMKEDEKRMDRISSDIVDIKKKIEKIESGMKEGERKTEKVEKAASEGERNLDKMENDIKELKRKIK